MNTKKKSLSPIIYNNGNKKVVLKIGNKEVLIMEKDKTINKELKTLILSDRRLKEHFCISLLRKMYVDDDPKNHERYGLEEYEAYIYLLYDEKSDIKIYLNNMLKEALSDKIIDYVVDDYTKLRVEEARGVLYTLSRLLYLQDKHKNNYFGASLDSIIRKRLNLIKQNNIEDPEQYLKAKILYEAIPTINNLIYNSKQREPFTEFIKRKKVDNLKTKEVLLGSLDYSIRDTKTYYNLSLNLNEAINSIETDKNMLDFEAKEETKIKELRKKYNISKDTYNDDISEEQKETFLNELIKLYEKYKKDNNIKDIQTKEDIKKWRKKAEDLIKEIENNEDALKDKLDLNYVLERLAYSDYQKNTYKLDLDVTKDKSDTTTSIQEETEQEEEQIPISQLRNHSLKYKNTQDRDYIMMSSTKQANDLVNSITSYASYNENIYSIQKSINELEKKKKKSASDKDLLDFLKDKLENRIKTREELDQEEKQLLNKKKDILQKIKELDNQEDIDFLTGLDRNIDKRLEDINKQKNKGALVVQQNLFTNNIEYKGNYITTSIDIDNFDLSKFTDEGITIFLYMIDQIITNPNIKDLTFDIDFIFNKMNKYKHKKKSVVRKEIENLTDILYNMNIRVIKEDKLNNLENGQELRVITGRQWIKDKKEIKDSNGLKSMTITFNDDFKTMVLNSKTKKTKLGDVKKVNQLQYYKIPLDLITLKNKKARLLGIYLLQEAKLNRKNIEKGIPLTRKMKNLYNNNYLKLKYNKKQGQFKKDIVYKLENYLNILEDNKIILYNTDAFDKLRYDLSNKPIEKQKSIFDEEIIEIKVIPQITDNQNEATK